MIPLFRKHRSFALWGPEGLPRSPQLSAAIAAPLFAGILLGCVVGLFSDSFPPAFFPLSFFSETTTPGSVGKTLLYVSRYLLLAALCSSCVLGVILLPGLAFLRGFFFAGAVSTLYAAGRYAGLAQAALRIGLPALAGLTAFLLFSCMGLRFSLHLLRSLKPEPGGYVQNRFRVRHLLLILMLVLIEACYCQWLLPYWL